MNDVFGSVESVKAVSDIFAPISGEVIEVNEKLEEEPELVKLASAAERYVACHFAEELQLSGYQERKRGTGSPTMDREEKKENLL